MKWTKKCPKCAANDVIHIPAGPSQGRIPMGWTNIFLSRYICGQCGFSEEWLEATTEEIERLRERSR